MAGGMTVEEVIETLMEHKAKGYRCDLCNGQFKPFLFGSVKCQDCGKMANFKVSCCDEPKEEV